MPAQESNSDVLFRAQAALQARDLSAALTLFNSAQKAGADAGLCSGARWQIAMLQGDFEAAWRESDFIREAGQADPHRFWSGEDFTGKRVILRCLHGYGDAVQMLRYAPQIAQRAKHLIVEVPPAMLDIAGFFAGVNDVITWGELAPKTPPSCDLQMEINELPYIFRTRQTDLPIQREYLQLPDALLQSVDTQPRHSGSLCVGLVWASGSWNESRSMPSSLLHSIISTAGVEFWNLQGGKSRSQWELFNRSPSLHDAAECEHSTARLAALIAKLDLVITTDTLAAHLAGAQGKRAWVLLEHAADWRWQHAREDSPWYPSLRLFRQTQPGNWTGLVDTVAAELGLLAKSRAAQLVA